MSGRTLTDALRWTRQGTELFLARLDALPDADLAAASTLPGWTRAHVAAHVAANAGALSNLVRWARTGERTPMYASKRQRDADIEAGAGRAPAELREWVRSSAADLSAGLGSMSNVEWDRPVETAQGRTVAAREVPWLRSREVYVHAVDLAAGTGFEDLPPEFLTSLVDDVVARRSGGPGPAMALRTGDGGYQWTVDGAGEPITVLGPLAGLAAYLAGRAYSGLTAADGTAPPTLPPWL